MLSNGVITQLARSSLAYLRTQVQTPALCKEEGAGRRSLFLFLHSQEGCLNSWPEINTFKTLLVSMSHVASSLFSQKLQGITFLPQHTQSHPLRGPVISTVLYTQQPILHQTWQLDWGCVSIITSEEAIPNARSSHGREQRLPNFLCLISHLPQCYLFSRAEFMNPILFIIIN